MNIYSIYCITNILNGKKYIGQTTKCPQRRWKQHIKISKSKSNNIMKYAIHNAIAKYGIENFKFEILSICSSLDELNSKEIELIAAHKSLISEHGYNLTSGGENFIHSSETKNKIADALRSKSCDICLSSCPICSANFFKSKSKGNINTKTCSYKCAGKLSNINRIVKPLLEEKENMRRNKIKCSMILKYRGKLSKKLSRQYRSIFNKISRKISKRVVQIYKNNITKLVARTSVPQYKKFGWKMVDQLGTAPKSCDHLSLNGL